MPASATVPPTEAAAALLPLGATIGPAGLGVMPYKLSFSGSFFQIADFIAEIDSLVHDSGEQVDVEGRLVTLNGFSLTEEQDRGFPYLNASFSVTTYLTPPGRKPPQWRHRSKRPLHRSRPNRRNQPNRPKNPPPPLRRLADEPLEERPRDQALGTEGFRRSSRTFYWDLRDRYLLPAVVLLLIAIVAVPLAIGKSSNPSWQESMEDGAIADEIAGTSAVPPATGELVAKAAPGLRDYRRRLNELEEKNPFVQQFSGEGTAATTSEVSSGGSATSTESSTASPETSAPNPTAEPPPTEPAPDTPGITWFSYAMDVRVVSLGGPRATPRGATRARATPRFAITCRS